MAYARLVLAAVFVGFSLNNNKMFLIPKRLSDSIYLLLCVYLKPEDESIVNINSQGSNNLFVLAHAKLLRQQLKVELQKHLNADFTFALDLVK
jgi:hypothetical protein